jgi:hypothetical protein
MYHLLKQYALTLIFYINDTPCVVRNCWQRPGTLLVSPNVYQISNRHSVLPTVLLSTKSIIIYKVVYHWLYDYICIYKSTCLYFPFSLSPLWWLLWMLFIWKMIEMDVMKRRKHVCSVYSWNPYVCKIYQTAAISWSLCTRRSDTKVYIFLYGAHLSMYSYKYFCIYMYGPPAV